MKRDELPALTGARFYAAILVYLNHVVFLPGCESLRGLPVFGLGGLGVTFFFVLSGFILAYNYQPTFGSGVSPTDYRLFLWDRFSKVYPTYLATLLLSIPVSIKSLTLPLDWVAVPVQLGLLQCWMPFALPPYYAYLNTVGWSISCEAFFYLMAPLLIAGYGVCPRRWVGWLVTGAVFLLAYVLTGRLVPAGNSASELYFNERFAGVRIVDFAVGVCLGSSMSRSGRVAGRGAGLMPWVGALWLVVVTAFRGWFPAWCHGSTLVMPGIVLLILGLASGRGFLVRHLSHRWIRIMGLSSFAFYMLHHLVLRYLKAVIVRSSVEVSPVAAWVLAILAFLATCGLSYGAYLYFEMPVQQAMRRWMRRQSSPGSADTTPGRPVAPR